jgi:serine/threonine-protein kinase
VFAQGRFLLTRVIGRGGMSTVYEAEEVATGERVALKVLAWERRRGTPLERFLQEARIGELLPRDHVVGVTEVGCAEDGSPFLVMELLEGRDLSEELTARGRLPVGEAVDLILQACEGVAAAHAAGLVHRDLKPANLFLSRTADGRRVVKVLDFGLSKVPRELRDVRGSMTQTDARFGTPRYMSPEQVRSTKQVDGRSDQHALGLVLCELLTGKPVFEGRTPAAVLAALCTQPAPSLRLARSDVPAKLDAVVLRALAKRPRDRHRSLAAFAEKLAPFGGEGAVAAAGRIEAIEGAKKRGRPARGGEAGGKLVRRKLTEREGRLVVTAIALATLAFVVVLAALMAADWGRG